MQLTHSLFVGLYSNGSGSLLGIKCYMSLQDLLTVNMPLRLGIEIGDGSTSIKYIMRGKKYNEKLPLVMVPWFVLMGCNIRSSS